MQLCTDVADCLMTVTKNTNIVVWFLCDKSNYLIDLKYRAWWSANWLGTNSVCGQVPFREKLGLEFKWMLCVCLYRQFVVHSCQCWMYWLKDRLQWSCLLFWETDVSINYFYFIKNNFSLFLWGWRGEVDWFVIQAKLNNHSMIYLWCVKSGSH